MLSSAGISLDVEKQTLLRTSLTLQEQLKESQAALLLEQVFIFPSLQNGNHYYGKTQHSLLYSLVIFVGLVEVFYYIDLVSLSHVASAN